MIRPFKAGLALAALLLPVGALTARADIPASNQGKVQTDIDKAISTLNDMQKLGAEIKNHQQTASTESGSSVGARAVSTTDTTTTTKKKAGGKKTTAKKPAAPKKKKTP